MDGKVFTLHKQVEKSYFILILKYCVFGRRFQIVNQVNDSKIKEKNFNNT